MIQTRYEVATQTKDGSWITAMSFHNKEQAKIEADYLVESTGAVAAQVIKWESETVYTTES